MLDITALFDQYHELPASKLARLALTDCSDITSVEVIHQARLGGLWACSNPEKVKRAYRELLALCQAREAKALSDALGG